jgi:DNA replication protein DnaC
MTRRWSSITAGINPTLDAAVAAIREVLERGWGWVYLWGPPGTGKTLALQVAVAESAVSGRAAAWAELPDVLGTLRSAFADNSHEARVNDWRTVPVLALDEMGRDSGTDWTAEVTHRVLGYRYTQALQERRGVTLFAANYSPEHLGDALESRVRDRRNYVFSVNGKDMRRL